MLVVRKALDRGFADHGWLKSYHSFSFANYYDPAHMGFGNLRVINEDRIAAGTGFGTHGHQNMEIVSFVMDGLLGHQDSMGNKTHIAPLEIQRMSAGTGIRHSEMNAAAQTTHFLQIWIEPNEVNVKPSYEQEKLDPKSSDGQLVRIAAPMHDTQATHVRIHADASIWWGRFNAEQTQTMELLLARKTYVYVVRGELEVGQHHLQAGDALLVSNESTLEFKNGLKAEVLVFDLSA